MDQTAQNPHPGLALLRPPYRSLAPFGEWRPSDSSAGISGSALVWQLARGEWGAAYRRVRSRPHGVSLVMVLPPADQMTSVPAVLEAASRCRPHSILPYHSELEPEELRIVLSRPPEDLAMETMDYLSWRGVDVDQDTRRLVRRTIELSGELRTVSGLARALYLSRRALGRRFRKRGLPVPSHILHFGRILRACLILQGTDRPLLEIAFELGYPDAFSLSNQMLRLTGLRPSQVRERLGWEWIVECWLRAEEVDRMTGVMPVEEGERPNDSDAHAPIPDPRPEPPRWRSESGRRSVAAS